MSRGGALHRIDGFVKLRVSLKHFPNQGSITVSKQKEILLGISFRFFLLASLLNWDLWKVRQEKAESHEIITV